ncbi:prepilin-type N-terminal cleavage/methylation domain-containing protein [Dyella sp. 2HG41-7]|uniref:prepilin-type N-terminal cleavage/methylation domain-containing protein n=1 Tax=Dyella sp. 2HG41-7 TaxID=2883239 RepID=UPI001F26B51D|nr:prepilin-type N-terminal cleavage/methylation domain-containing protein [Dyella sp. 2HG41-7]
MKRFIRSTHHRSRMRGSARTKYVHGFTLLEVLGAMALLALLLLGVYSGVRSATHTVQAGEVKIEQLDEVRSAQEFLRRELAQAMAQPLEHDDNGNVIFFDGSAETMRFVAPLPGYLGRMGPQMVELKLIKGEHGKQLVASLAVLPPDGSAVKPLGDPQVLMDHVIDGGFSYRGVDQMGRPTDWQSTWKSSGTMPNLVTINLALPHDRRWPLLSVPLRVNAAAMQGPGNLLRGLRGPGAGP